MVLQSTPVRAPRILVKIDAIKRPLKSGTTVTQVPIIVLMKSSHASFFGLTPITPSDPIFQGTFPGTTGNGGAKYVKRLGGFRHESWKFIGNPTMSLTQTIVNPDGSTTSSQVIHRSISVGFPKGPTVNEIIAWLATNVAAESISAFVSPRGAKTPIR